MDWRNVVGAVAPGLATVLGGPLAGSAVKVLADKLLGGSSGDPAKDEAEIAGVLAARGDTPEVRAALIAADKEVRLAVINAGTAMRELEVKQDGQVLDDIKDARKTHGANADVLTLGVIILVAWAGLTGATLFGLYQMLTGGIRVTDVGIVATVFTVLGSTVGYVSNIAQQVVGFYFGSSRGSANKDAVLAGAITEVGRR